MIVNVRLPAQSSQYLSRLQNQLRHQIPRLVGPRVSVPAEAAVHRQLHRFTTQAAGATYASDAHFREAVDAAQLNEVRQHKAYSSSCVASAPIEQVFKLR